MSTFGKELIQSLNEALSHAKGEGPATVHTDLSPREVRKQIKLTQAQMAPLMGMSLSGYRKWEQGRRQDPGPDPRPIKQRICFRWTDEGPCDVEIVDYH